MKQISPLLNLKVLHIYSSKIQTLEGIELLPIEELFLARNNQLEDIQAIEKMNYLKNITIEKCAKISNYNLIENLRNKIKVSVI